MVRVRGGATDCAKEEEKAACRRREQTHGGGRRGGQRRESGFRVCVGENGRDVVGGGGDRW